MRRRLERFVGQRHTFRAVFIRFGKTPLPGRGARRWMLIEDVEDSRGRHITLHMWMPLRVGDHIEARLRRGDVIRFTAEVDMYVKGSRRQRHVDYGLRMPRDVVKVEQEMDYSEEAIDAC